jgi:hypothetical protein
MRVIEKEKNCSILARLALTPVFAPSALPLHLSFCEGSAYQYKKERAKTIRWDLKPIYEHTSRQVISIIEKRELRK